MAWGILNQDWDATQKGFAGMMVPGQPKPLGKKRGRSKKTTADRNEDTAVSDRHFLLTDETPAPPTKVTGNPKNAKIGELRAPAFVTDRLNLLPAKKMAAQLAKTRPPKQIRQEPQEPVWVTCGQCNNEFDANKEAQFRLSGGREVICPNDQCRNKFAVQPKTFRRNDSSSQDSSNTERKSTTTSRRTSKKTASRTQLTDSSIAPSAASSRKRGKQD